MAGLPGISSKLAMLEDVLVLFVANFVEVVHVELADKGTEVAMSEKDRQNLLLELLHVVNSEVSSFFVPTSCHRVGVILDQGISTSRIS